MIQAVTISTQERVRMFADAFTRGMTAIAEACGIYADALDADPDAYDAFREAIPQITPQMWGVFEGIGRGQIDARLIAGGGAARSQLLRLPLSEQERALDDGVKVLVMQDGEATSLLVKPEALTPGQRRQVFAGDHVRSLSEQRAYVEGQRPMPIPTPPTPWEIRGGKLRVLCPTEITRRDLAQILAQLER